MARAFFPFALEFFCWIACRFEANGCEIHLSRCLSIVFMFHFVLFCFLFSFCSWSSSFVWWTATYCVFLCLLHYLLVDWGQCDYEIRNTNERFSFQMCIFTGTPFNKCSIWNIKQCQPTFNTVNRYLRLIKLMQFVCIYDLYKPMELNIKNCIAFCLFIINYSRINNRNQRWIWCTLTFSIVWQNRSLSTPETTTKTVSYHSNISGNQTKYLLNTIG